MRLDFIPGLAQYLGQLGTAAVKTHRMIHILGDEVDQVRLHSNCAIDCRIRPLLVSPNVYQVTILLVEAVNSLESLRQVHVLGGRDLGCQSTNRGFDIDRGIDTCFRQSARQHNMPVKNGAGRIRDWIGVIVTLDQNRVKRSNRTGILRTVSGPFDQLGKAGEN